VKNHGAGTKFSLGQLTNFFRRQSEDWTKLDRPQEEKPRTLPP
jgi:hypothetical protein